MRNFLHVIYGFIKNLWLPFVNGGRFNYGCEIRFSCPFYRVILKLVWLYAIFNLNLGMFIVTQNYAFQFMPVQSAAAQFPKVFSRRIRFYPELRNICMKFYEFFRKKFIRKKVENWSCLRRKWWRLMQFFLKNRFYFKKFYLLNII